MSGNCASGSPRIDHQAGEHGDDGNDDGDNGTADEKLSHGLARLGGTRNRLGIHGSALAGILQAAHHHAVARRRSLV